MIKDVVFISNCKLEQTLTIEKEKEELKDGKLIIEIAILSKELNIKKYKKLLNLLKETVSKFQLEILEE